MRPLFTNGSSYDPLFVSKRTGLLEPLLYFIEPVRIRMPLKFSIQTIKKCSILEPINLEWSNTRCQTRTNWSSLDCMCAHQSIYGIYSKNDLSYYGFQHDWFYASTAIHLFASFVALSLFIYHLIRKPKHDTFSVFLVCSIQVIGSNVLAVVMYLITVLLSPLLNVDESGIVDASNSSCMVMAIVFHFVIVLQFSSMFMNAFLFYLILVKGYFALQSSQKKKSEFVQ